MQTKDWKAWENDQPGTGGPTLHVTGLVETSNSNQTPVLTEASPQGINPAILILNLSITTSGVGNDVMGWKPAPFRKSVKRGQYSTVDIHHDGKSIAQVDVKSVQ
jgi:hypothetical protein